MIRAEHGINLRGGVLMKKAIIFSLGVVLLAILSIYKMCDTVGDDRIAVLITVGYDETYYFSLEDDNILKVRFGHRNGDDALSEDFAVAATPQNVRERTLRKEEMQELKKLAKAICENCVSSTDVVKDVWEIRVFCNDKFVRQWIYKDTDSEVHDLIDELKRLSPIEINMRGLS